MLRTAGGRTTDEVVAGGLERHGAQALDALLGRWVEKSRVRPPSASRGFTMQRLEKDGLQLVHRASSESGDPVPAGRKPSARHLQAMTKCLLMD
jgi:hypothetical protein